MGLFDGIKDAKASRGANYVKAGHYLVLIRRVKQDKTRKGDDFVAIEMVNLVTLAEDPAEQAHRPGEQMSQLLMRKNDSFLPNFKAFVSNVMAVEESQVGEEEAMEVVSDEQPLSGRVVELQNKIVMTKKDTPFTLVNYVRSLDAEEIKEKIPADVIEKFLTAEEQERLAELE